MQFETWLEVEVFQNFNFIYENKLPLSAKVSQIDISSIKVRYTGFKIIILRYAQRLKIHTIEVFVVLQKVI